LILGTCVALASAFALLRSGIREHRGARDRIDGGVDGDYEGREDDAVVNPAAFATETDAGSMTREAMVASARRGASRDGDGDGDLTSEGVDEAHEKGTASTSGYGYGVRAFLRFARFIGDDGDESHGSASRRTVSARERRRMEKNRAEMKKHKPRETSSRRRARLHVTRDPKTGHLTMNDIGSGVFRVTQPRPCAPIATEADDESHSVTSALIRLRTEFRVGKILRRCDRVDAESARAFVSQVSPTRRSDGDDSGASAESFYARLVAAKRWGALCYSPDFLRGVASTVSVCSRNHEDGVALALFGFCGFSRNRASVSISDAGPGDPERGASAYLIHNHGFRGVFVDATRESSRARAAHFANRRVPTRTVSAAADADAVAAADDSDRARWTSQVFPEPKTSSDGSRDFGHAFVSREPNSLSFDGDSSGTPDPEAYVPAAACVHGSLAPSEISRAVRSGLDAFVSAVPSKKTPERTEHSKRRREEEEELLKKRIEIDLLTVDVVGRFGSYALQPVLETVAPRVVAVAYDSALGPVRTLTSPPPDDEAVDEDASAFAAASEETSNRDPSVRKGYRREGGFVPDDAATRFQTPGRAGGGTSLSSFVKVLERWGYFFVGCEASGESAFFVRSDVIESAHRAGRGSVHVTTPEDSGCFSPENIRTAMRRFEREVSSQGRAAEDAFVEVNEAWVERYAPGPTRREDETSLQDEL
jgi:hypothetical protein